MPAERISKLAVGPKDESLTRKPADSLLEHLIKIITQVATDEAQIEIETAAEGLVTLERIHLLRGG
jgi:hypothetical protein